MKTIILAGGLGSRMREETEYKPKPMVEIGERPILWHIIKNYNSHSFSEFIVCMGYKKESIIEYFVNFNSLNNDLKVNLGENNKVDLLGFNNDLQNTDIILSDTGLNSNTGERIRRIKKYIPEGESFMLTYGDGLSDVNITELLKFHNSHPGIATFTATYPQSRFGVIKTDENNLVTSFDEKGQIENRINCGFMVLDYGVFDYIEENDNFEQQSLKRIADDKKLFAFNHDGYFQPMDTYREYKYLNSLWEKGKAPWKVWND
jgi:glucose-1-phosphate cytidylyltransferase|tara:strand:+ start:120 stop:902 length:783 start_codon:yes stop_codon:yes gene_type:complete